MAAVFARTQGAGEVYARDRAVREMSSVMKVDNVILDRVKVSPENPTIAGTGKKRVGEPNKPQKAD